MSNLSQQSETALIYLIGCLSILLRNILLQSLWHTGHVKEWPLFWLDNVIIVTTMFLAQTYLAEYLPLFVIFKCALIATAYMSCGVRSGVTPLRALRPLRIDSARAIRNSHTMFRALLLLTTALAILAVDFSLFPRRFAKTHYYGQSLMDTGTAAFVFVNALADQSVESMGQSPRDRAMKATMNLFIFRVPTMLILFLLGIGRSLFVNFAGYSQDVTEYGVHWNFFVTLFFLRLFVIIVPTILIVPMGLLLGIAYQSALTFSEMESWMLDTFHKRNGFIEQNREGIFTLLGYCFLYSISLSYSRFSSNYLQRDRKLSPLRIVQLFGISIFCYIIQRILEDYYGLLASRRLANLPYCFSMLALFSATTLLFQLSQIIVPLPHSKGGLVDAISRNALLHFLIANLLTGFVNIWMRFVAKIHNQLLETAIMILYSLLNSLMIFIIYLMKKKQQNN